MNLAYLLIGGNMGDRMANLNTAKKWVEIQIGSIQKISSIYETAAWGHTNQADFLNQLIVVQTELNADKLMQHLLEIELKMGRERDIPMGPRTIDLDIIYFNNEVINLQNLTIPHPKIAERRFVLTPLCEIDPEYIHPILNKSNASLLKDCGDSLAVYKKTD